MQLAVQNTDNQPADKKPARSKKDARAGTIAAIHITWGKICRGKKLDKDELRQARLDFMSTVLNREVTSAAGLSQAKLGKVLDAMRDLEREPLLPGANVGAGLVPARERVGTSPTPTADVVHLATAPQVAAIDKIFLHLGWRLESVEKFVLDKFKVKSHRMLTVKQANSLTMILLNIAASHAIKQRWKEEAGRDVEKVSRAMIRAEIPALKRRLGIDQKPSADSTDYAEEELEG